MDEVVARTSDSGKDGVAQIAEHLVQHRPKVCMMEGSVFGSEERTHLPCRPRRFIIWILPLHRSIYLSDSQTFARTSENGAAQDDRKCVLRSAIGIWETREGIGAVGMRFMSADDNLGARWRRPQFDRSAAALRGLFGRGGGCTAWGAHSLQPG